MNELPMLTIVIPNHNYGRWLLGAMRSVAIDEYINKQIMVVDDGSTDDSWVKLCTACGIQNADEPRDDTVYTGNFMSTPVFAYRFPEAGGPSRARNLAIQAMWNQTHFFGFLDADDEYLPGKIKESVDTLIQDTLHIGAVYTDYDTISIDTGARTRVYKEPFNKLRLMQECIVHSACVVNKRALHECGLYDESMRTCEDFDLWLRISQKFLITHIPKSLMLVRVGSHNSTTTVDKNIWMQNWQKIRDKLANGKY